MSTTIRLTAPHPASYAPHIPLGCPAVSWRQTAAEVRAYCRVNGIRVTGPMLAKAEYRTGPHPKCAYAHLPIHASRVKVLRGQLSALDGPRT